MAPDFSLPSYEDNQPIELSSYKGKVVLVNFWATWCPPCRAEIPDFIQVQDRLRAQGFAIIGVSLDEGGAGVVAPFVKDFGINYPVAMGDQEVVSRYGGIRGIPTSFLIDREGRIAHVFPGMISGDTLEQAVKALL
jgi:peroxiredoxin